MALPEPFPPDPIVQPRLKRQAGRGKLRELLETIVDGIEWALSDSWAKYLTSQGQLISDSPARQEIVELEDQTADVVSTSLIGTTGSGLYRLTYYATITQAATVNSSLTVSFGWTDAGVSKTFSGAAITGNTTATYQTGTLLVDIDAASPITYSTTYASTGATAMQYKLDIWVEG